MNSKFITASWTPIPSSSPATAISASPCPVFRSACDEPVLYGFRSTKPSGSAERISASCSCAAVSPSSSSRTYSAAGSRRWKAHSGQTFQFSRSFSRYRISPHEGHFSHTSPGSSRRSAACSFVFGFLNQAMDNKMSNFEC